MTKIDKTSVSKSQLFAVFHAYKKIGTCSYRIATNQVSARGSEQIFPNSWFTTRHSKEVYPFLEIMGLETLAQKGIGNGKLCLQALFEVSQKYGCNGRMLVNADFNSGKFYEHCGFQGKTNDTDGLKYFNPTPQNLELLFSGTETQGTFKFIPISVPESEKEKNSVMDKALMNRMLEKAQRK